MKKVNVLLITGMIFMLWACPDPETEERDRDKREKKEKKEEKKDMELEGAFENDFFSLPPLPYKAGALEPYIDWKTMKIHHQRHHKAYVSNLNNAAADNEDLQDIGLRELMRNISNFDNFVRNNGGGHYNHDLFWRIMGPDGGGDPDGALKDAVEEAFGSVSDFRQAFNAAANRVFGAGWAWLAVDDEGELFITTTPNQDNPLMDIADEQGTPILGLDLWEHAYYLNYQNQRGEYIQAFWNVVNWAEVNTLYERAIAEDEEA